MLDELRTIVSSDDPGVRDFYELMLDYPLREAKGLRPALCIAVCRALGGSLEAALPSSAALELFHNAFLIHDDVEDGSEKRRESATLHRVHGVPIAINVGDGMLALALTPLLENTRVVGLSKSLRILQAFTHMARATAEGQATELSWIRNSTVDLTDDDYRSMVVKKTGWYSFITPFVIGAIIGGAGDACTSALTEAARQLSIAFQIRDDVLNLETRPNSYGKELNGDLWEGKRTLILIHMLRNLDAAERERASQILRKPRRGRLGAILGDLEVAGGLSPDARHTLERELGLTTPKTEEDVAQLLHWIERAGSVDYATAVGSVHGVAARESLERAALPPSSHRELLEAMVAFTLEREL